MNTYRAGFEIRQARAWLARWAGRIWADRVLTQWIPGVGVIVLLIVLASGMTALAAESGRTLAQTSPLPTPTFTPTAHPTAAPTTTPTPAPSQGFHYTVRAGDTLFSIARRYGIAVQAIITANGIVNPNRIFAGQVLWIPSSGGSSGGPHGSTYIVRWGDTLYSIARRFGTTYLAIATANGLRSPYTIYVGQRLVIPGAGGTTPPPSQRIHIVQRGETLYSIAIRYGTTPWAIVSANHLWNMNLIYVGQRLVIP